MIPDIVKIKRLCASGQWIAKVENGKILLHDTVAGETVCIGKIDAVPVVRCKDCVEYIPWLDGKICARIGSYFGNTKPNDFCSHGKRRCENDTP